ncbi:related to GYP7 - GTPase-activating protein for Ypt7p [Melanopsichium pennsylvanicum]|uniref:Related to GYP7 - GTPase-activating protein for Ypt7p n=2 Tax=Melanopsichium pennsylvanicum TaxID=63383 RepID=A0AAJ5C554_9BASI|nr:related to GYP7-GTPase-activating protein for Ypt7p [Melanopsichium pennsylvanicum 4]SNX84377.1 related to GYP7 - GTPase-activating protein for Ypt7p [Melanopsichium pennsylvanicum]
MAETTQAQGISPPTLIQDTSVAQQPKPSSASAASNAEPRSNSSNKTAEIYSPSQSHTLLWSKSKVYVHPSPYAKNNVPGYLALSQSGLSHPGAKILLSFLPESLVEQRQELEKFVRIEYTTSARANTIQDTHLDNTVELHEHDDLESRLIAEPPTSSTYAFSLPLTSIHSFTIKTPTISSWYGTLTISQVGGVALPTLHFHDDESKSTVLSMYKARQTADADAAAAQAHAVNVGRLSTHPNSSSWSAASSHAASSKPTSSNPTWGGDELVQQLRKYANINRSAIDPNLFLVNPSRTDLETHSTPLFDDDAIDLPHSHPGNTAFSHDLSEDTYSMSPLHQSLAGNPRRNNDLAMDNLTTWAKSARMSVLSSFAQFTQQARHASHAILSHPLARPYVPHLPGPVQSFAQAGPVPLGPNEGEWEWRSSSIANNSGTGEYYDSARVYLARWARLVAEEGERNRRKEERLGANLGDAGSATGPNAHRPSRSGGYREEGSELGAFEVLEKLHDLPRPTSERETRLSELNADNASPSISAGLDEAEWRSLFSPTGEPLHSRSEIRHRVFVNGLTNSARKLAWPFLLDAVPFSGTSESRAKLWEERQVEYHLFKARWQTDEALLASDEFREQQHRVRVDCLRTDRTQPIFARSSEFTSDPNADPMQDPNPQTARLGEILLTYGMWEAAQGSALNESAGLLAGYVQGMSDLCSPLYIMMDGDEVKTFWCFVGFMERTKSNFYRDQSGMKTQLLLLQKLINVMDPALYAHLERTDSLNLFFCFRWLLVRFKREFRFDDTVALWEACWAAEPCQNSGEEEQGENGWGLSQSFHIFQALSLLELHRDYVMRYLEHFDEILQYFNSLSGEVSAEGVICKAEILARSLREIVLHSKQDDELDKLTQAEKDARKKSRHKNEENGECKSHFLDILTPQELELLL